VLPVLWSRETIDDLVQIIEYIEVRNPNAASSLYQVSYSLSNNYRYILICIATDVFQQHAKQLFIQITSLYIR
jgi:hypothetical protein